jgi:hypothetical protein
MPSNITLPTSPIRAARNRRTPPFVATAALELTSRPIAAHLVALPTKKPGNFRRDTPERGPDYARIEVREQIAPISACQNMQFGHRSARRFQPEPTGTTNGTTN